MIDLDEHHSIRHDLVRGIRPMYIVKVRPGTYLSAAPTNVDPDRCQVLIGDHWIPINRGVPEVRALLRDAVDAARQQET